MSGWKKHFGEVALFLAEHVAGVDGPDLAAKLLVVADVALGAR